VESIGDFDLSRFHPHPPGYPVYVVLLRLIGTLTHAPMRACMLAAAASGAIFVALTWDVARRAAGERAAWLLAALAGTAPLAWRTCTAVGSEAPALACAAACAWGLVAAFQRKTSGSLLLGFGAGLGLGVRLSWGPLFVAALLVAPPGARRRALAIAGAASLAWALPFVAWVGPASLWKLYGAHLSGHAERWGGTVLTEPGLVRGFWLVRDVFVDGFGTGTDALGIAIGALLGIGGVLALAAWRNARWVGWRTGVAIAAPYATWIAFGQNLRDQPRHALPLVILLSAGLAIPLSRSARSLPLVGGLVLLVAVRTSLDAVARRAIPPPGQQLVALAREQPDSRRPAVFGAASVRFFETSELASHAMPAASLGDVLLDLGRMRALPARVWVTSELQGFDESSWPLRPIATLCRPPRIERRAPCVAVYEWDVPYLSKP